MRFPPPIMQTIIRQNYLAIVIYRLPFWLRKYSERIVRTILGKYEKTCFTNEHVFDTLLQRSQRFQKCFRLIFLTAPFLILKIYTAQHDYHRGHAATYDLDDAQIFREGLQPVRRNG